MRGEVFIHAIGTAVPAYAVTQEEQCRRICATVTEDRRLQSFITRIYAQSGIKKRHTVLDGSRAGQGVSSFIPGGRYEDEGPTTMERNNIFVEQAPRLSVSALEDVFRQVPGVLPGSITHLITVSCTGFSAPGFNFRLIRHFNLPPEVECFHLGFMGCLGAFPALRLARSLCRSVPGAKVLIVCCELCSLHYRHRFDFETLITNSLFADGAAAVFLSADPGDGNGHGIRLKEFYSKIIADSGDEMGWIIGNHGFEMVLSKSIPSLIEQNMAGVLAQTALKTGISKELISSWAIHPGGRAILDRTALALGLDHKALADSYSVLSDYGNMSSATVLFALKNLLDHCTRGISFSAAFGPGLTAESAVYEVY